MFGKNPIRKQDLSSPEKLWIQEVFPTIQGEGPFAGQGAIFVRLGGCNLRCWWCDTDFESSTWHPTIEELVAKVREATVDTKTDLVVLTGGEPFRQDIAPFCQLLIGQGFRVQIETNGTLWLNSLDAIIRSDRLSIVVSPKTGKIHPRINFYADAFKYIVSADDADSEDGLPMLSTQTPGKKMRLARPDSFWCSPVYVQPLDEYDEAKNKANEAHAVTLVKRHGYRLSYQIHKHLGLP